MRKKYCPNRQRPIFANAYSSLLLVLLLFQLSAGSANADTIKVATASNFLPTLNKLKLAFLKKSPDSIQVMSSSSGTLYTQIIQGAPYDLFLSADIIRPLNLETAKLAIADSRKPYAMGQLIIWTPDKPIAHDIKEVLRFLQNNSSRIAIANPELAPYGSATQQSLKTRGFWSALSKHMVMGESISQTFQFAFSRNVDAAFIGLSQIKELKDPKQNGTFMRVPSKDYRPIEQQMVLLKQSPLAVSFYNFILSTEGRAIISRAGYGLPTFEVQ